MNTQLLPFIEQVRDYLSRYNLQDPDPAAVYAAFTDECRQFEVSEKEFYKHILRPAYRQAELNKAEDPDPPNKRNTQIKVLGTELRSLKRLGQLLYDNKSRAMIYLEDASLLRNHVDYLEDGDTAIAFGELYRSEPDPEKRYLKVCYTLHPQLPYRLGDKSYQDLESLLQGSFSGYTQYQLLYQDFTAGKLQLWLEARSLPINQVGKTATDFHRLAYQTSPQLPFFIGSRAFVSVEDISQAACEKMAFWKVLYQAAGESFFIWLQYRGHPEYRAQYLAARKRIIADRDIKEDDRPVATVQQLLLLLVPAFPTPNVVISDTAINRNYSAAAPAEPIDLLLQLNGNGYCPVHISLRKPLSGVTLLNTYLLLTGSSPQGTVRLLFNPLILAKDEACTTQLQIQTPFEEPAIVPIQVTTRFPVQAYLMYLVKYGITGFVFLGAVRWLLAVFIGHAGWLPSALINQDINRSLPPESGAYPFMLLVVLASLALIVSYIRRTEKI